MFDVIALCRDNRCQGDNKTCYTVAAKNYSAIGNDRRLIRQNAVKIAIRIRLTNVRYLCIFKIQLSLLSDLNRRMRILRPRYNHLFVYDPCFKFSKNYVFNRPLSRQTSILVEGRSERTNKKTAATAPSVPAYLRNTLYCKMFNDPSAFYNSLGEEAKEIEPGNNTFACISCHHTTAIK